MYIKALQIARSKSDVAPASGAVDEAMRQAQNLALLEAQFESRINASKAARGEKPTQLSRARRAEVDGYAADAQQMHSEQLAAFEAVPSAYKIFSVLKSGLDADLKFWVNAGKHTHPQDMPIVQELVDAKRALKDSLVRCLATRASAISSHPV
jgi:hypothetical protein